MEKKEEKPKEQVGDRSILTEDGTLSSFGLNKDDYEVKISQDSNTLDDNLKFRR